MALVLVAVAQQGLMELADMILAQAHVGMSLEHEVDRLGVSGHFLLVARLEGPDGGRPRAQVLDLGVGQLRPFDARRGADALYGRDLAECAEALRREGLEGLPPALELVDFGDELHQVGAENELGLPHRRAALLTDSMAADGR